MDDSKIIDLYFNRDEKAIEETSRKYGAYCYTVASNILSSHEDAEECVNDTWMRTWNSIPPQRPQVLKLFLLRITRNISLDRVKAVRAKKRGGGETELAIEELSECIPGAGDVIDELIGDEHSLPDLERAVFVRRYFFLESVKAVADRYGMSEGSVMTRLSRTRKKLKALIEKEMN